MQAILSSVIKSLAVLPCPSWDVNHLFVQRTQAVHATRASGT